MAGGGADVQLLRLCADCGAPIGRPYVAQLPFALRSELPLGPNNGVLIWRRVPGTDEWIQLEYFPPDDAHDDFWLVEPLLPLKVAAIALGLRVKTLYDRAHRMASSEKHGRLWFFKRDLLLTVDAVSEAGPSRAEILTEREERRARGEVRRAVHIIRTAIGGIEGRVQPVTARVHPSVTARVFVARFWTTSARRRLPACPSRWWAGSCTRPIRHRRQLRPATPQSLQIR